MKCHTQAANLTTNLEFKIYFTSSEFSATKIVAQKYHMNGSTKGRNDMILCRDLLTELGLS